MSSTSAKTDRGPLLGALLRIANQAATERFTTWLTAAGYGDIQPAHSAAIQPLWEMPEGLRITSLARSARITKQSMSALVDHLETTGYVERVEDPDDARATRVSLTTRGRAYAKAVRAFGRALEVEWAERIGSERIADLRATLELLRTQVFMTEE
jgi:DNA-binding MarR family transcriptional regulator